MLAILEQLKSFIKQSLSDDPYRYFHSLFVYDIISDLSNYHSSLPLVDLQISALAHDMFKNISIAEAQEFTTQYHESIPQDWINLPVALHGFLASIALKYQFNINNKDILEAVCFHTTGKGEWSLIGLALYVSDFLASIHQTKPELFRFIYQEAQDNLYQAAYDVCISKIEYLEQRQTPIHQFSLDLKDWLNTCLSSNK